LKERILKFLIITILIVTQLALFVSCKNVDSASNNKSKADQLTQIRYANLKIGIGDIHTSFAIENGIYKKHGIDLKIINFAKGGAEAIAGVASGQVDAGSFGTPILTGITKGISIKVVASPAIKGINFVLVATNDIKTVKDLKGKTVATGAFGGGSHQSLLKILATNGMKESDVKVVATGGTDEEMILKSGKVSAVITSEPTVSKIELEGAGHTLVKAADVYGKYQHTYIFATDKLIKNNPEAVRNLLEAHKESITYAKEHQEELIAYTQKKLGLDESLIIDYFKKAIPTWDESGKVDIEGLNNAIGILKELGEIDKNTNISQEKLVDLSFQSK